MKRFAAIILAILLIFAAGCAPAPLEEEEQAPVEVLQPEAPPEPEPIPEPEPEPDPVEELLAEMTLEEKVGQLFFVHFPQGDAGGEMAKYNFGGCLLFASDAEGLTAELLREKNAAVTESAKIAPFIGADEEGGTVVRLSRNPNLRAEKFLSPQRVFADGGWEGIAADAVEKSAFLRDLGLNVNFAPVCDVSTNPNDFIYSRSFGAEGRITAQFVRITVEKMTENNLCAVLKHFPGYGSNADTHVGASEDERTIESFRESDFKPFLAGVCAGKCMVMVSHNTVKCMDAELPASLSHAVHEILRQELSFDGVIITDDLTMGAVSGFGEGISTAVLAIAAGNDMVCCADYAEQIPAVIGAVESGELSTERIDESVRRILTLKLQLGIIEAENGNSGF